jgi:sugar lactone lactonase YvrE
MPLIGACVTRLEGARAYARPSPLKAQIHSVASPGRGRRCAAGIAPAMAVIRPICPLLGARGRGAIGGKSCPALVTLSLLALGACGGGGGGGSGAPKPPSGPATTNNTVVATVSPPPPIRAYTAPNSVLVGPLIVVTFTTSDQRPATDLQVTGTEPALVLPTWAGPGTAFRCASVSSGNGCTMTILYQLPTVAQGDLAISYSYKANNGASKTGVVHIAYVATQPSLALLAGWVGGPGFIDGTGSGARFNNPSGVAVDAGGAIYVADAGNFAVRKIAPGGIVTTLMANGNFAYSFTSLTAAALDLHGNVYVGDGNAIRMLGPGNNVPYLLAGTCCASGPGTGLTVPRSALLGNVAGVVVDTGGNIYASSSTNDVVKLEPNGSVIALAGTAGEFNSLGALTMDAAGTLYAVDNGAGLRAISPAGMVTTVGPLAPTGPATGLAVDSTGALITSVALANSIYTTANGFTKLAGDDLAGSVGGWADGGPGGSGVYSGGGGALFNAPTGVALEPNGNLIVADTGNSAIREVTPAGIVSTLAGVGVLRGAVDGTGASARFDISQGADHYLAQCGIGCSDSYTTAPAGVAADATGNVFITDTGNGGIRKVTPAGVVTTVPGAGGCLNGGIAVDGAGNLYVTICLGSIQDFPRPSAIRKITPQGAVTLLTDTSGNTLESGNAETWTALAVDTQGSVYVIDGNKILKITSTGVLSTWAGGDAGAKDGTGTGATFAAPGGIAFAPSGDLYVADTGNHTIRRITPGAVVTTFVGQSGVAGQCGSGFEHLSSPRSLTVDFAGAIYVVNSGNNSICRVTQDRQVYNLLGGPMVGTVLGTLPTTIDPPQGIAARPDGQIVFTVDSGILVTAGL